MPEYNDSDTTFTHHKSNLLAGTLQDNVVALVGAPASTDSTKYAAVFVQSRGNDAGVALGLSAKGGGPVLLQSANMLIQGPGSASGLQQSDHLSYSRMQINVSGIVNNTATDIAKVTIPNGDVTAVFRVTVMATFDVSPIHDSTRVVAYHVVVTRRTGVAAVAAISSAIGAQIATLAGGATLTTALTLSAISGTATDKETVTIQVTNVASAGTPTTITTILLEELNGSATGVTGINSGAA